MYICIIDMHDEMKTKTLMVILMDQIWVSWWAQVKLIVQFRYFYYILHNNVMVDFDTPFLWYLWLFGMGYYIDERQAREKKVDHH